MSKLAEKTIALALSAVGVQEADGHNNRGKWVDVYTRFLGLQGVPWCACFVAFKVNQAAKELSIPNPWPTSQSAASTTWLWSWAKRNKRILERPVDNCVFLVKNKTGNGCIHTGFVVKVNADGTFDTCEGNSNENGSSDGYEVVHKTGDIARRVSPKYIFVRID